MRITHSLTLSLLHAPRSTTAEILSSVCRPTSSFKQSIHDIAGFPLLAIPCACRQKIIQFVFASVAMSGNSL